MEIAMIDLVVFDMAGTTVQDGNAVQVCLRAALAAAGVEAEPAAVDAVMGLPKPQAIRLLLDRYGSFAPVDPIHDDFTSRMQRFYASDPAVREVAGAAAAFAVLRRTGVKVALDTGFFRPIVNVLLGRLGWHAPDVIDADVTSDEVARGRPHPDMILHLMARLGVADPRRVAKVGDTQADMEEGTNAGCGLVIGVLTGSSSREQLQAWPHTHIVASVADVPALALDRQVGAGGGE
jgi:phosphonatase-like hydrolase